MVDARRAPLVTSTAVCRGVVWRSAGDGIELCSAYVLQATTLPPSLPRISLFRAYPTATSGFTFSSVPHSAATGRHRVDFPPSAHLLYNSPVNTRPCRRRPTPSPPPRTISMVRARNGGYGRFSDTDDEPSFRLPPPAAEQQGEGWVAEEREWQEIGNADVLIPREVEYPLGVVHFVGGQGVGMFPKSAYGTLLAALVDAGASSCAFRGIRL